MSREHDAAASLHWNELATPHPSPDASAAPVDTVIVDRAVATALHAVRADIVVAMHTVIDGAVATALHAISANILAIAAIIPRCFTSTNTPIAVGVARLAPPAPVFAAIIVTSIPAIVATVLSPLGVAGLMGGGRKRKRAHGRDTRRQGQ